MPQLVLIVLAIYAAALFVTASTAESVFFVLTGLIAVGTLGFWALLALEAAFVVYCLDNNEDDRVWAGWSTLSVVLTLCVLQFGTSLKPLNWIFEHPYATGGYFGLYVLFGLAYSVAKWYLFNTSRNRKVDAVRKEYLKVYKISGNEVPPDRLVEWKTYFNRIASDHYSGPGRRMRGFSSIDKVKPSISEYRDRFIGWIALWPLSFAWTMLNDPLVRLFNNLYELMRDVYQNISDHVFQGLDQELDAIKRVEEAARVAAEEARAKEAAEVTASRNRRNY